MNHSPNTVFTDEVLTARAWYREQHPGDHAPLVLQVTEAVVPKLAAMLGIGIPELRFSLADRSVVVLEMRVELTSLPGQMQMLAVPA